MNTGLRVTKLLAGGVFVVCVYDIVIQILNILYTFVK